MSGQSRIVALVTAAFFTAVLGGCQAASGAKEKSTAEAWKDVEESRAELDALLEAYDADQKGKSTEFPAFEARGKLAGLKLAQMVQRKCVGAVFFSVESWEEAPCVYETMSSILDPSGNVARYCKARNSRQAFMDCASNGIGTMVLKKSLRQEMTAVEWRDPVGSADKAWRDFAARSLTMCIAESAKNPINCLVTKTGIAFAVPEEDVAFCTGQQDEQRRTSCIANAAALATIERSLATGV